MKVASDPLLALFTTKPLPPTNFKLGEQQNEITFVKSPTVNVK